MTTLLLLLSLSAVPDFEFPRGTLLHNRYEDLIAGRTYRAEAVQMGKTLVVVIQLDDRYPDFDHDNDVDQEDWGALQTQLGTNLRRRGITRPSPFDLDSDGEVGPDDAELFTRWPRRAFFATTRPE